MTRAVAGTAILAASALTGWTVAAAAPGTDVVPCSIAIEQSPKPYVNGLRLVLGRIWLPRRTLQLGRRPGPGWDRFAKVGIVVRAGSPVVLEVPVRWRSVYSLEYVPKHIQTVADGSRKLSVRACAGPLGRWSAYAGGYVVKRPVCVPLTVRADGRTTTVDVAVGRSCTPKTDG
jgi:hypothetical protein